MQLTGIQQLINGVVLSGIGICVIIKSRSFAEACKKTKVELLGEARHDNVSVAVARFLLILVGVVFMVGSLIQFYQFLR